MGDPQHHILMGFHPVAKQSQGRLSQCAISGMRGPNRVEKGTWVMGAKPGQVLRDELDLPVVLRLNQHTGAPGPSTGVWGMLDLGGAIEPLGQTPLPGGSAEEADLTGGQNPNDPLPSKTYGPRALAFVLKGTGPSSFPSTQPCSPS